MKRLITCLSIAALLVVGRPALGELFTFSDPSGLSAEAELTLLGPFTLQVRLKNTSTGVPDGFTEAADQILTSVSWDFGAPGEGGDPVITDGAVIIGPNSETLNFDTGHYGPGYDVSGEYGYGNQGGTGLLQNLISANSAQTTRFIGENLDGPKSTDGPQAGLVANPFIDPPGIGKQGTIQDEIIATLTISDSLENLDFLYNGVRVEFGSDAAFGDAAFFIVPEPGTPALVLSGLLLVGAYFLLRWKLAA